MATENITTLRSSIQNCAKELLPRIIRIRRHLHANPELSFQEFNTSAFVADELEALGIPFTKMTGTGIVALIKGKNPSKKVIALRADLDALPIREKNETEYCSKNEGVMHACGHDVHTASLIGVAHILQQHKNDFEGTMKLIFQPGEEKAPGGASLMIKDGVLENPAPVSIFAQHVFPSLPAGKAGFRSGMYMASTDELYMTVKGKGGHAAMVKEYVNPVLIASTIIAALHQFFMEESTKLKQAKEIPTVLAFGKIEGKGATNVIPDVVLVEGTFRTMNEEWRAKAHEYMRKTAEAMAKEMGGTCEFRVEKGYPFLVNDSLLTDKARAAAEEYLGKENVVELEQRMTAEDFAFYSQKIPACFYRLGTASPDGKFSIGVHNANFDVDESSLLTGMGLMAYMAIDALK
ncbi:MAG TPA: M20 family metallopeptidase [Bacteroidia bacterium]|jgi:amidohydrolase|nr:M20 family metallopeptidase [Bacteroidia bacterium]